MPIAFIRTWVKTVFLALTCLPCIVTKTHQSLSVRGNDGIVSLDVATYSLSSFGQVGDVLLCCACDAPSVAKRARAPRLLFAGFNNTFTIVQSLRSVMPYCALSEVTSAGLVSPHSTMTV